MTYLWLALNKFNIRKKIQIFPSIDETYISLILKVLMKENNFHKKTLTFFE